MAFEETQNKVPIPEDLLRAKRAGYVIIRKNDWHYHVTRPGSRTRVNVWWTTKKLMQTGEYHAWQYEDLVSALSEYFEDENLPEIEEVVQAQAAVDDFRKDPLAFLKKKQDGV